MFPARPQTASVLAIGDEVLRGEIVNTNAATLSERLFDLGLVLREHLAVSDEPGDIRAAFERLRDQVDVLVVTGGLGPTDDDRTLDVLTNLLGVGVVVDEPSRVAMEARFAASGFELTPNNMRQVRIPVGAEPLQNRVGIAPGFRVALGKTDAYFMPGVPREMNQIFEDHVVPRLCRTEIGRAVPAVRTFHVYGMGESQIDHKLSGLLQGVTGVTLHFRTAAPENHVKLVVRGPDAHQNLDLLDCLSTELLARLGSVVYGMDADTLPLATIRTLRKEKATLALAESCTGGYAGQLLTTEPGASDVFAGGVVTYANAAKVALLGVRPDTLANHGAVSEACALEMAIGARRALGVTLAVSVTGIAGDDKDGRRGPPPAPLAGTKAVGTVCFGVAGPRGTHATTKIFSSGRERIRRAAAYFALDLARRHFE